MSDNKHKLTLLGGSAGGRRTPVEILLEVVGAVVEGARRATRYAVEGESIGDGPRPAWLDATCQIQVSGLSAGSCTVALEAPLLHEAAPELFLHSAYDLQQQDGPEGGQTHTAIDLFGHVLAAVLADQRDPLPADRPLIDTCIRLARAAENGFDGVQLQGVTGHDTPLIVTPEDVLQMDLMREETPEPSGVYVAYQLPPGALFGT